MATQPVEFIKRHGGGKYGEIVLRHLIDKKKDFICYYDSKRWLNPEVSALCNDNNIPLVDVNEISVAEMVKKYGATAVYSPVDAMRLEGVKCKKFITVHGLRNFETPDDSYKLKYRYEPSRWVKEVLKSAFPGRFLMRERQSFVARFFSDSDTEIITVSNHSKNSILTFFPEVTDNDIPLHVLYSPSTSSSAEGIKPYSHPRPYFLIVSGNRWVKNALRAIIAFERLKSRGYLEGIDLIVTGVNDRTFRHKFTHPEAVVLKGYVSDEELESLYCGARMLVYPSLNEGFGYPPLEAMKYGVPVISSSFTSIPEVCGDAAVYFNPLSIEEIMNRMLMMQDEAMLDEMSARARKRYDYITARQNDDLDRLVELITKDNTHK